MYNPYEDLKKDLQKHLNKQISKQDIISTVKEAMQKYSIRQTLEVAIISKDNKYSIDIRRAG